MERDDPGKLDATRPDLLKTLGAGAVATTLGGNLPGSQTLAAAPSDGQAKLAHYAQEFVSTPGKKDGLYFPTAAGEKASPLGPLFDTAKAGGYAKGKAGEPVAYPGYHYRMLKAQGPDAPGGAYDYVAQGRMIGGHALVAWPATYGNSGVMTFLVSHDGVVYEKDLGPSTATAVAKIVKFNPDKRWKRSVTAKPG